MSRILPVLVALFAALPAWAGELRVGVFVGNNAGRPSEQELIFAAADARKMRDLFEQFGNVQEAVLLENESRRNVVGAISGLHKRIVDARNQGDHTTLFFYYSGHGDSESLHLGSTDLTHEELRKMLDDSGADVRIAMLDACQSGGVLRAKGGVRGPSFGFAVDVSQAKGTAFLTSSAASELSQESAEVGGGFFTHYLHSALLGAGDANRDGEVTLPEAYQFVYGETVFSTRDAQRTQTPEFDFDLTGAGAIPMTTLEAATSKMSFLGDLSGTYSVWDESRKRYVAEVDGSRPIQLAVRPGSYFVHKRMPGWVDEAEYQVRRGETRTVVQEDFVSVPYEQTAARGDLDRVVRRAKLPDVSLRMMIGGRSFGDGTVVGSQYIPQHGLLGVEARFQNGTSATYWSVDFQTGGGPGTLNFAELGQVPVIVQAYSGAVTFGFTSKPALFQFGMGGRAQVIGFTRHFVNGTVEPQSSLSLAPGIQGWAGIHPGRAVVELQHHTHIMATSFTDDRPHPAYMELYLTAGYRF
ncbi:MAG: caspase family protein [Alphaproteobacteria bacterium]|nr:caspase family protein [Alphaproteobacteria bacterium]